VASTTPTKSHRGTGKNWNKKAWVRVGIGLLVLAYVIAFVVLNNTHVGIDFVFFSVRSRLWVGFLVCLVLGGLLATAFAAYRRHGGHANKPPADPSQN
jgi:uncharacterized integral membrane protein